MISIAIDGPCGSGKSTVAKELAKKLGFVNVDTGALYRAIAHFLHKNQINFTNEQEIEKNLGKIKISLKHCDFEQKIFLGEQDITKDIRMPEISMIASQISAMPCVRGFLLELQRDFAKNNNVIMDGRDIGTVVLPNANVKIFLTASPEVRAKRRYNELVQKNKAASYNEVLDSINKRDFNDTNRKIAPLQCADDAVFFDNSDYTFDQTVGFLLNIIKERIQTETE